jgi:hypothetical protein
MTLEMGLLLAGILGAGIVVLFFQVRALSAQVENLSSQMESRASLEAHGGDPRVQRARGMLQRFRARSNPADRPVAPPPLPERRKGP